MDGGTATRIAKLAVDARGQRVLEIGAGTGALTAALVQLGADVTAFDVDPDMVAILRSRDDLDGARIELGDALAFDYGAYADGGEWRVAGNLPYNVATPLLIALAALPRAPERIVAMIQKDVAERLLAKPGTAQYGSLTVAIGLTMRVERALTVPPSAFFPRPKVTSTVVTLHRLDAPAANVRDRAWFEQVVRGAFAYRRKTLLNSVSLALGLPRERIAAAIASLALDPDVRGEALDLRSFAALADALAA
ncbi:MAG TPA: 16S rRNA (adenine(1518)-N(6)/adenine(1519)-N(6))-dimethyltransferase RsmA [Candidatus Elarobacter sp.]|jgi:16S rRNA (adenine1518-N6/adenine1519-N6)-dimethyltransferase|nr:16S rRNA (adenine(1518)-N(6)/adenine(1519)-N(6))-dimethyltransferase RsmA [Candidatus Elarobacter sp.]